ncbi:MAG: hypothetical protein JNM43_07750 [Planctomycetaceae bacterium]|nr:hypothetical protein [Planctomycetaceae bacterium]
MAPFPRNEDAVDENGGQPIPKEKLFEMGNEMLDLVESFHGDKPIPR